MASWYDKDCLAIVLAIHYDRWYELPWRAVHFEVKTGSERKHLLDLLVVFVYLHRQPGEGAQFELAVSQHKAEVLDVVQGRRIEGSRADHDGHWGVVLLRNGSFKLHGDEDPVALGGVFPVLVDNLEVVGCPRVKDTHGDADLVHQPLAMEVLDLHDEVA